MNKIIFVLFLTFVFLYPIPYTLYPVYADVKIEDNFGFGDIKSLAEGTQKLINPIFQIAAILVVLYFLLAAFKYLKAGANKEDVAAARAEITHAIIGFILLIFAFFVLQFIPQFFNFTGQDIIK